MFLLITQSTEIGFSSIAYHLEHVMISGEGGWGAHVLKHEKSTD